MKTILYLEDELKLSRQVSSDLQAYFEDCRILAVNDGLEGLDILRRQHIDVLILDLSLPSVDGAEILDFAMNSLPHLSVIVTSSYDFILKDIYQQTWPFPFLRCVTKPFEIKNLLRDLDAAMQSRPASVLNGINPISVLQLAHLEGKNCRLEVITPDGEGVFVFRNGDLVSAFFKERTGIEAVTLFLNSKQHSIRIYYEVNSTQIVNNIFQPFNHLLISCCQLVDEEKVIDFNSGLAA